jgi:hypothetical protein
LKRQDKTKKGVEKASWHRNLQGASKAAKTSLNVYFPRKKSQSKNEKKARLLEIARKCRVRLRMPPVSLITGMRA